MAPRPKAVPRHEADALGLGPDESAFREGSATIVMPTKDAAFLNPVQEFNRDLSVIAITAWSQAKDDERKARMIKGKLNKKGRKEAASKDTADDEPRAAKRARTDVSDPSQLSEAERQELLEGYRPYSFTILEALSATGLRSIRYAREIPLLRRVIANDLAASAVEAMKRNVALNFPAHRDIQEWVPGQEAETSAAGMARAAGEAATQDASAMDEDLIAAQENGAPANGKEALPTPRIHPKCRIQLNEGDAISYMYQHRDHQNRFDVVDLDPYGSASPFIDGAVQCIADDGLLLVTCTDLAILAGNNYPEKCYSAYGGSSSRAEFQHEAALRLVLHSISTSAARYGRYIQPLLSLSIDFYVRIFIRVSSAPIEVKKVASQEGMVYVCNDCSNFHEQHFGRIREEEGKNGAKSLRHQAGQATLPGPNCEECGGRYQVAGPMWLGPLHDADFCRRILARVEAHPERSKTAPRIKGMVSTAMEELPDRFFFTPSKIAGAFQCLVPPMVTVVNGLLNAGFTVSRSHAQPGSIKTSATRAQVHDLFRTWIKSHPVNQANILPNSRAANLLAHTIRLEFDLDTEHPSTKDVMGTSKPKVTRYQNNPEPNWGPGSAAKKAARKEGEAKEAA